VRLVPGPALDICGISKGDGAERLREFDPELRLLLEIWYWRETRNRGYYTRDSGGRTEPSAVKTRVSRPAKVLKKKKFRFANAAGRALAKAT